MPALLLLLSGAAGLVWQMLWTARLGIAFGHEIVGVLSVLGAFFGGLALGSLTFGSRLKDSRSPALTYALLEAVVAVWALGVSLLFPAFAPELARWIGPQPSPWRHWGAAFFVPLVLLAPATMAMGATLPAIEQLLRRHGKAQLGVLYAANTVGAMAGVLLAVFVCIPDWGLDRTAWAFAAVNAVCALAALWLWRRNAPAAGPQDKAVMHAPSRMAAAAPAATRVQAVLLATGLLGIGYEVLAVRVLSQVTENTVYSYALLLAVYLLGTAAGAWLYQRLSADRAGRLTRDRLLTALAGALLAGGVSLWWADAIVMVPQRWLGAGLVTALAGETAAAAAALALPTLVMGALFTHLAGEARASGMSFGRALGLNTFGAAIAPLLIGVVLLPATGARGALLLLVLGYLLLRSMACWRNRSGWVVVAAVTALALFAPPLRFIDLPEGGRLVSYREGVMAAVSVVEDAQGVARLHINNRIQEGSSASGLVEIRLAQLPLLLHPAPRKALLLGLGTGYTANAAALDPALDVQAVELLPEVIEAAGLFALRPGSPPAALPVRMVAADARRFMQSGTSGYDVVVADLFHPARSGAGGLYTVEHFAAVRARLLPGGVFCQWLALHQMDLQTLRSIVAAFTQVYPDAIAILASNSLDTPVIGLVGRPGAAPLRLQDVQARLDALAPGVAGALKLARLDDAYAVLGSVLAGPASLRQFAAGAVPNTDDQPVVAQRAPWTSYRPGERPRDRLIALVRELKPVTDEVLPADSVPTRGRVAAYWQARRRYLEVGMIARLHPDPAVMLQQLRGPLLEVVAISPEFRPAAEPLVALAQALRPSNPGLADLVLTQLRRSQARDPSPAIQESHGNH
ncbi:MAG: fused MFS/spermidine synthase [Ramlibacter sp.]|nr:fused MFS/spermidine synthase [Ramlibacter sp.]